MARLLNSKIARTWPKPRPKTAHKGTSGRVFIIAGSRGMMGAGVLCAMGTARAGAGLVRLGIVESQQRAAAKRAPLEVTTQALPEDSSGHLSKSAWRVIERTIKNFRADVVAFGPGVGVTPPVKMILRRLIFRLRLPLVLDADGLNAMAQEEVSKKVPCPLVITPHAGELARLLHTTSAKISADREGSAVNAAHRFGCVCLLKGAGTIVTDGRTVWKNTTGNPAMASGGMGDVLTGIIAALWAQSPVRDLRAGLQAAALGAYLHGLAGDLATKKFPEGSLLASDLISAFPRALRKCKGAT